MTELVLRALSGANPLGFLAAVGTLRMAALTFPACDARLHWKDMGSWRPILSGVPRGGEEQLCEALAGSQAWAPLAEFEGLGANLTVSKETFAAVVAKAGERTFQSRDRRALDFLTAFGNEAFEDAKKGRIEFSSFSFITGSGHQHFLGSARALNEASTAEQLREALFGPWRYQDQGNSFRWDPDDAKEYALRWRDPSKGGARSVWGANRLAFEALPLFPVVPVTNGLRTTGFDGYDFTWPIWHSPASIDVVRSLVGAPLDELRPGAEAVTFTAQRVRIGQGANFKVSFRPSRAV